MPQGWGARQAAGCLLGCGVDALLSQTDEADDLIATLADGMARRGAQGHHHLHRQGFCQLICPQIRVRDYFNKRWLDAAFVQQQYGVAPSQPGGLLALTGIGGSNIKGTGARIGPKTATQLLQQYGTLAALLDACRAGARSQTLLKLRQLRMTPCWPSGWYGCSWTFPSASTSGDPLPARTGSRGLITSTPASPDRPYLLT